MKSSLALITVFAATSVLAEDSRQLDAHEHGVGTLNIAIDGTVVAIEFRAPGSDIVGFEYEAESDADLAAIDAAIAVLGKPLDLFVMPEDAVCVTTAAEVSLESEEDHDEHEHDDEHHDEHADDDHDEHEHEKHDEHGDEDHAASSEGSGHTEFHAQYALNCENPGALTEIVFDYFGAFPEAKEVEVQMVSASGSQAFEVERDEPVLTVQR